ncbi:hypothetical protein ACKWTF_008978 [Chironomus riparius]
MNEIDPTKTSNGSATSEIQHQEGSPQNTNRSPLLSSLLTSVHKHDSLSNGQEKSKSVHSLMMPSSASAIVANPQYDESVAYLKKASQNSDNNGGTKEVDLSTINSHRNRIHNNLNELLQRNNNNNKVASSETTTKSILENCLLKPSTVKSQQHHRLESQFYNKMNDSDYHHGGSGSSSATSVLKFAHQEENRKVEPLKINLNRDRERETLRTVIKIPQPHLYETSPTKITIKPPHPPPDRNNSVITTSPNSASVSISPTLSSSSHSSESSYENFNDSHQPRPSIQIVPKLHLRTPPNHEQSELHIVPKLTITGLNSPQTSSTLHNQLQNEQAAMRDHSVNSILDGPAIPKLTIKKDNNTHEGFYHLNHEGNTIPKLHIKTNHHHHHSSQKDGMKLTIKPLSEQPPVPKLTIKTTDNDTKTIVNSVSFDNEQAIPKLTIKANQQPMTPKLTIKPVVRPAEEQSPPQEESIPKLTLKAVNNRSIFEKVVPKLVVKLPKETQPDDEEEDDDEEKESSSCSSTPSPPLPLTVPKLNIKQIPIKEVPKQPVKNCTDSAPQSEVKFSINRLIGTSEEVLDEKMEENLVCKPLEINTSVLKNADSGQDSPRIILKINKTNNESTTTEIIPQLTENVQKTVSVNHKRTHPNDNANEQEELPKKPKLNDEDDDVIIINDSDASNEASNQMNSLPQHSFVTETTIIPEKVQNSDQKIESVSTSAVTTGRSLRQTRRNQEAALKAQQQQEQKKKPSNNKSPPIVIEQDNSQLIRDDSQGSESIDPLALSNDGGNSNSVDELITPKRGRGRPKKIAPEKVAIISEESVSRDPLEIDMPTDSNDNSTLDNGSQMDETSDSQKKSSRGRGRGRGRLKRTVEVIKNGKPVQITLEGHDDDDSPSFSLYNRSLRGGFTGNKRSKGGKAIRGGKGSKSSPFVTPERSKDSFYFMTPNHTEFKESNRKKLFTTPSLFEEDTRMSMSGNDSQSIIRTMEMHSNEESQSSIISSTSNTIDGSTTKKRQKKMDMGDSEGRMEFMVDMLAEYDWPLTESGKNRDTYMIQEQIAEYLGIKSFKRKYPDLVRRPVDMEERNHLFENGLASEKMCDLGLTAVYASEVLDIMCNDYPEKYEEYKRYQREKIFKHARLRLETAVIDRSQMQKDKAITSASEWNTRFNKDRRENRRCCMDLQNCSVQKPTPIRDYKTTPSAIYRSPYPVALVPGQFSEFYEKYTPEQLACYPINTVLVDFNKLQEYLKTHPEPYESSSDSSDSSDDEGSDSGSSTDSDSSDESSEDEYVDPFCKVCSKTPFTNRFNQPEKFIKCSTCKNEAHPSCIQMSQRMYIRSLAYSWQCSSCKSCSKCRKSKDNKMLYCIQCDRGFHIYCLGLRNVPEGKIRENLYSF